MASSDPREQQRKQFEPEFFLWHCSGPTLRATFSDAGMAEVWQKGIDGDRSEKAFYVTDGNGRRVTFKVNRYGHASAILDALEANR